VSEGSRLARLGCAARDVRRVVRGWREEVFGRAERPRALGTKRLPRRRQPQNQLLPINFFHCQQGRGGCGAQSAGQAGLRVRGGRRRGAGPRPLRVGERRGEGRGVSD
jgi:hypothetical protein